MKKEYKKPICEVVKMETIAPIAASGLIYSQWTPWRRNIHWDDDGYSDGQQITAPMRKIMVILI